MLEINLEEDRELLVFEDLDDLVEDDVTERLVGDGGFGLASTKLGLGEEGKEFVGVGSCPCGCCCHSGI